MTKQINNVNVTHTLMEMFTTSTMYMCISPFSQLCAAVENDIFCHILTEKVSLKRLAHP